MVCLLAACLLQLAAQTIPPVPASSTPTRQDAAETLYLQLGSVGLDRANVYRVRDFTLDRGPLHITLDDGTIAFTQEVAGHVTGAFFEGDGEVLLVPPDQGERASMALFTGAAILEERFVSAYFRFNDETFEQMKPALSAAESVEEFVSQWDEAAHNLAGADALRLFMTFSHYLPAQGGATATDSPTSTDRDDQLLHARLQSRKLGTFDLYFDSNAPEQISAGQLKTANDISYYDVWTSFSWRPAGKPTKEIGGITEEGGASDAIHISDCRIRAEIKPPTELKAEAWLQLEARRGGSRAILFELSRSLHIDRVEANGEVVDFIHNPAIEGTQLARRGNDVVAIVLPEPLRAGERLRLHFVYEGEVLSEAGSGLLYVGARGIWYPNRGLSMTNFDLEFHYPPEWTLVATGKRVEAAPGVTGSTNAGGEQVTRWVSERPLPVAGFNLGRYTKVVAEAGKVTVETYAASGMEREFPKGQEAVILPGPPLPQGLPEQPVIITSRTPAPVQHAQAVASASARAIGAFARWYGPYPYSDLALTQMPGALSQGWPGLIFLSSYSFLTKEEQSQLHMSAVDMTLNDQVVMHETAHQWWGDLVMWSSYRDQWMVEALANYSSLMLLEAADPARFRAVMESYRDDLLRKNPQGVPLKDAGPVTLGTRLSCSQFPGGYDAISYGRGTWLFHMLRYMLRDAEVERTGTASSKDPEEEPFVKTLRTVRERYAGKAITTRELLRAFEDELPASLWYEGRKSLDWFYENWVSGTAIPQIELRGVKYTPKANATLVSGTILQKDAPKDLVTSVPVYAVRGGQARLLGRVFADGPETPFRLSAPDGTRKIVLDVNQTLLARVK